MRIGGARVDVLTLAVRDDLDVVERSLRERGELIDGVRLLNVWTWMADWARAEQPAEVEHATAPIGGGRLERRDAEGVLLQRDHYRSDGSLAIVDRRDSRELGS